MEPSYYVALVVVVAIVVSLALLRQRGTRQRADVEVSVLGVKGKLKTSVDPEMEGIKAGRDVKAIAGEADPARMKNVEAGRDVVRDTTRRDPKA